MENAFHHPTLLCLRLRSWSCIKSEPVSSRGALPLAEGLIPMPCTMGSSVTSLALHATACCWCSAPPSNPFLSLPSSSCIAWMPVKMASIIKLSDHAWRNKHDEHELATSVLMRPPYVSMHRHLRCGPSSGQLVNYPWGIVTIMLHKRYTHRRFVSPAELLPPC